MKITIAVIFGGESPEHDVSIISGVQAMHALDKGKYHVLPIYIDRIGRWLTGDALMDMNFYRHEHSIGSLPQVRCFPDGTQNIEIVEKGKKGVATIEVDVAMPVLHGGNGEDGSVQGLLTLKKIPVAGSSVFGSALGMNKFAAKVVAKNLGVPITPYFFTTKHAYIKDKEATIASILKELNFPLIVKPNSLGSSIGISIATDREELEAALNDASQFDLDILVEKKINFSKEVNCSVIGDVKGSIASVCEEPISTEGSFLTYEDKYLSENQGKGMANLSRLIPADIPDALRDRIQEYSTKIFDAFGCSGVARIDYLISEDSLNVYFNEINTIPGSLSFYLWENTGLDFTALLERMVSYAFVNAREYTDLVNSFESSILMNTLGSKQTGNREY